MRGKRHALLFGWAVALLLASGPRALPAEPTLRLRGIPDSLVLPLPEGSNVVLTATITGTTPRSVWLAKDKAAKLKLSLTQTGRGEYQVNLADPEVAVVLETAGARGMLPGAEPDDPFSAPRVPARAGGQFQVFAELDGGKVLASLPVGYSCQPSRPKPPKKLDFSGSVASMVVYQRQSAEIPGSGGRLFVALTDITHGQVHVTVRTAQDVLLYPTSLRQGESLSLDLSEEQYVLYLRELVNVLIGDDWAVIDISRVPADELKKIDRLLARIASAEVRFIREGLEYNGKEAAEHLRQKLSQASPPVKTLDEFIQKIASRSSTTSKPCHVKLSDGKTIPAEKWLKEQAARLDEEPKKRAEPEPKEAEAKQAKPKRKPRGASNAPAERRSNHNSKGAFHAP